MKKVFISGVFMASVLVISAQLKVSTKSFDLESINRNKGWNLYSGFTDENDNTVLKIGQSKCDQTTRSGTVTSYGVAWEFEELTFDKELNYLKSTPKSFPNSLEALQYEPIWGKTFSASNISLTNGGSLSGLTSKDFGKTFVIPTASAIGTGKVSLARVESELKTILNDKGTASIGCSQYPVLTILSSESVKDEKGQKWALGKAFSNVGSSIMFFQVSGDGFPNDKLNIVARKYNLNLTVDKELAINIDFNTNYNVLEVNNNSGNKDYIIVLQSCNKYAPKGLTVKEADYAEIIYIDGLSLEVKLKESIKLPYTKWFAREAVALNDGSVMVFGPAGSDNKSYIEMPGYYAAADAKVYKNVVNDPKNSPNLLALKIKNNKVESIVANTIEDAKKVTQVIGGSSKKSNGTPVFNYPSTAENANVFSVITKYNRTIYCKNDKIIVCYQALIQGSTSKPPTLGDMTVAIFDNNGKVEKMFLLPESEYANNEEYFSNDNSKMYWITYDYLSLNKQTLGPGVYEAKKVPKTIATIPQLSVIDLSTLTATNIQKISSEEWGIDAKNPIVAHTEKEIIFQGKSISKKAKDSELILIRVEK
jgi:hypothetical protein